MDASHGDLGPLLKSWRQRRSPLDVGLPLGTGRRAAGLRREELAALAGLSVDYIVRLEQGRARNPSDQVTSALARALQLDAAERDHLFRLAGLLPPSDRNVPRHIPPSVQRLVARLGEVPLAVYTASWDLLAWSPLWAAVLGEPAERAGIELNLVALAFGLDSRPDAEGSRVRFLDDGEGFRRSLVADLRRVSGRYPDDRQLEELIATLRARSAEFAELWRSGAVGEHEAERKTIEHPVVGTLVVDCDVFNVAGTDLRIVAYTVAAGTPEADKLDFLRVTAAAGISAPTG
ncbi:MAG: helix-turn-helix transcriptional regulator [Pseudolysinimonas sp.]